MGRSLRSHRMIPWGVEMTNKCIFSAVHTPFNPATQQYVNGSLGNLQAYQSHPIPSQQSPRLEQCARPHPLPTPFNPGRITKKTQPSPQITKHTHGPLHPPSHHRPTHQPQPASRITPFNISSQQTTPLLFSPTRIHAYMHSEMQVDCLVPHDRSPRDIYQPNDQETHKHSIHSSPRT